MAKGKTILIKKKTPNRTTPNNYTRITCRPIMLKILTAQITKDIYDLQMSRGLFLEE